MNVADLEGDALKYWSARASGQTMSEAARSIHGWQCKACGTFHSGNLGWGIYALDSFISEGIAVGKTDREFHAWKGEVSACGPTPHCAATRCYITLKFGAVVPDEPIPTAVMVLG